jgi:hypothetical protein
VGTFNNIDEDDAGEDATIDDAAGATIADADADDALIAV